MRVQTAALVAVLSTFVVCGSVKSEERTTTFYRRVIQNETAARMQGDPGSPLFALMRERGLRTILDEVLFDKLPGATLAGMPDATVDIRFISNLTTMVRQTITEIHPRIFGGHRVQPGDYLDVVNIRMRDGGPCSGTLITNDVVLTAGHCACLHPLDVFFGTEVHHGGTETIGVDRLKPKIDCTLTASNPTRFVAPGDDFALVWLRRAAKTHPREIAIEDLVLRLSDVTAVGFGYTDEKFQGIKMQTDVPIASPNCTGTV